MIYHKWFQYLRNFKTSYSEILAATAAFEHCIVSALFYSAAPAKSVCTALLNFEAPVAPLVLAASTTSSALAVFSNHTIYSAVSELFTVVLQFFWRISP